MPKIMKGKNEMKRTYPIICPSCQGTGRVPNPYPLDSNAFCICPACQGRKSVIVTEEDSHE